MSYTINYTNDIHLTINNDGVYESITLFDKSYENSITLSVELAKNVFELLHIRKVNFVADYDEYYIGIDKVDNDVTLTNLQDSTLLKFNYDLYKSDFDELLKLI